MEFESISCTSCYKHDYCKKYQTSSCNNGVTTIEGQYKITPSIRNCQTAVCELHYTKIKNKDVLEVGCGSRKKGGLIKKIIEKNNCKWTGIDIKETDLTSHVCSVTRMPFEDNSFDCVIGSQTFEHWKKPAKALKEIRRVLKPEGKVYLTTPIHLHGGKIFVAGNFKSIEKLFLKSGFDIEKIETWRKNYCDLGPYLHKTARKHLRHVKKHLQKFGTLDYEEVTIYLIHCILTKNKARVKFWKNKKHLNNKPENGRG